ncbi:hypothetical protein IAR55_002294 [Kwoniella newhampshirensis]|uniref:Endonuclease/exonuclease/phosphatase domain-containing protein n=1 Tax=Kwoniella newhampshirensis TaxID=1651941 RepID=A0AAW0Z164_9TREE
MRQETPLLGRPDNNTLKVFSFNVWGLAIISKDRHVRIRAIAEYLASSSYDIVCLQELWVYKDYEIVREEVSQNLPFSRFFHTGALGSGLAIFTRFPLIAAHALPYSLSGSPAQAFAGDFFVKKAAANIVILHPVLGEVEIWNTHMHAAGEHPPDTRQAHRIAQSWQLANAIRSGAAKGRYILAMGDFNSQPWSVPVAILRNHANLSDSFLDNHQNANNYSSPHPSAVDALSTYGMTCDSSLNTYSADKNISANIREQGGKRLDYIFYRQPAVARRRPLVWGYRDNVGDGEVSGAESGDLSGDGHLEAGKPIPHSVAKAPRLRCVKSEVVLTERVPGQRFSYSDHFALFSTFAIDPAESRQSDSDQTSTSHSEGQQPSFTPLIPLITQTEPEPVNANTTTFAPYDPPDSPNSVRASSASSTVKSSTIRNALNTLHLYTRISQQTASSHLKICAAAIVALIGLTIGSAWQPKSWLQPIFTLVGGLLGAAGATFLYTGFVWGRWEEGLLREVTEEMELELRVVEMEEKVNA